MGDEFLIAALVYVIACLGLVLYLQKQSSKLKTKVNALTVLVKESDRQREAVKRELHELRSGTIGVGRRVVELEKKLCPSRLRSTSRPPRNVRTVLCHGGSKKVLESYRVQ